LRRRLYGTPHQTFIPLFQAAASLLVRRLSDLFESYIALGHGHLDRL